MHRNIPELLVFFCLIFSDNKMLFFGLSFILYVLQLSGRNGFFKVQRTEFFVILGHFLPFDPPNNPKNQNFEKKKKTTRDIVILHFCNTN